MPNTAELLLQTHPPSSHNMPSISSHLFPSYAPQWAFMDHFHHTKPALCTAAPYMKSPSAFFPLHWKPVMCGCFHWNQRGSWKLNNSSCEQGQRSSAALYIMSFSLSAEEKHMFNPRVIIQHWLPCGSQWSWGASVRGFRNQVFNKKSNKTLFSRCS